MHTFTPPRQPHEYPRRILICMVGLSPAVVTETLYALTQLQNPLWLPTELHLITTLDGAQGVHQHLLGQDGQPGQLAQLIADYLPGYTLDFDPARHLHLVADSAGPVADIVEPYHQTLLADTTLRVLRQLATDPDCAIHASIAGGRKSMSFYMGYTMSLVARSQDRLSHVLVMPDAFEHREFYYPTRQPKTILSRGLTLNAQNARLALSPVHFVRLTQGTADWIQRQNVGFDEAVALAQLEISPQPVYVHVAKCYLETGGYTIRLEPMEMVWYAQLALARRAQRVLPRAPQPGCVKIGADWARSLGLDGDDFDSLFAQAGVTQTAQDYLNSQDGFLAKSFREKVAGISQKLLATLGPRAAQRLRIIGPQERGKRDGWYGLMNLAPEFIVILNRS